MHTTSEETQECSNCLWKTERKRILMLLKNCTCFNCVTPWVEALQLADLWTLDSEGAPTMVLTFTAWASHAFWFKCITFLVCKKFTPVDPEFIIGRKTLWLLLQFGMQNLTPIDLEFIVCRMTWDFCWFNLVRQKFTPVDLWSSSMIWRKPWAFCFNDSCVWQKKVTIMP
jgi:hypothetical protein